MSATLFITILLLAIASFTIYRSRRSTSNTGSENSLPPPRFAGLFGTTNIEHADNSMPDGSAETAEATARLTEALRTKARQGDVTVLREAFEGGGRALYEEILDELVALARSDASPLSLGDIVMQLEKSSDLRASKTLAGALIDSFETSPTRSTAAGMLHVAALSDDAPTYQRAVDAAILHWQEGRLPGLSAEELRQLVESQYWALSTDARRSGAGFILKQTLAESLRQLKTTRRVQPSNEN